MNANCIQFRIWRLSEIHATKLNDLGNHVDVYASKFLGLKCNFAYTIHCDREKYFYPLHC